MQEVKEGKDYSFPGQEEEILEFWDRINAFQGQLERTKGKKPFVFYDGPPFATGLPHYGHLLAGTIKVSLSNLCSCHCIAGSQERAGRPRHGVNFYIHHMGAYGNLSSCSCRTL